MLALGGPGIVSLRALGRVVRGGDDLRTHAAPLAHSFLHLFNLPEVTALIRGRDLKTRYWQKVSQYAAAGNLQAVMDEYAHVLSDPYPAEGAATISELMIDALTLRSSTAQADLYEVKPRGVKADNESFSFSCRFAMRFGVVEKSDDGGKPTRADQVRTAFNSPFWPFVLATTSIGQEGLDFHRYCHAVVHWNLPSNPVDLEQREGRIHRYKSHAVRKNLASRFSTDAKDPWESAFNTMVAESVADPHLRAFWLVADGEARIERHVPAYPQSRDVERLRNLQRSLVLYRMVFGQNRQEDLVHFLSSHLTELQIEELRCLCRIDLNPVILKR